MARIFIAVDLAPALRAAVADALGRGRPMAARAKWVAPDAAHVTLAFLGSVTAERVPWIAEALGTAAASVRPFDATLTGPGTFGRPSSPRVLWLGLGGDVAAFTALHAAIAAALAPLGFAPEDRPFRPHVTLARARDPRGDHDLMRARAALESSAAASMRVEDVVLFESRLSASGARYVPVARAVLAAAGRSGLRDAVTTRRSD
jgi:2'-5' RNA ligase